MTKLEEMKLAVRQLLGDRCVICQRTPVEYAHVRPTKTHGRGRGSAVRYADMLKHPESYAPFCSDHHKQLDAGKITTTVASILAKRQSLSQ